MSITKIKINGREFSENFASFQFWNELEYATKPERVIDGTLENDRVDSYYIPKCEFSFSKLSPQQYSYLAQALNTQGFFIECFDYELGCNVRRCMAMTKLERNKLLCKGGNLELLLNTKFSMESKFAYFNYNELEIMATQDSRF